MKITILQKGKIQANNSRLLGHSYGNVPKQFNVIGTLQGVLIVFYF